MPMSPTKLFPNPQENALNVIRILRECDAGTYPEGDGITDDRGNARCLAKLALEQCRDEIDSETVVTLLDAAKLRITRRGKVRYIL